VDRVPEQQLTFITLLRASFAAAGFAGIAAALLLLAASAGFCWLLLASAGCFALMLDMSSVNTAELNAHSTR
jgi:hypothetical protein